MKKIITLSLILFSSILLHAQSGLQFGQVRLMSVILPSNGSVVNLGTVPAGKVWKLEQVQHYNPNGYTIATCSFRYNGGSVNMPIPYQTGSTGALGFMSCNSPTWWPGGTVIDVHTTGIGVSTLYFSIIEFDVVQ